MKEILKLAPHKLYTYYLNERNNLVNEKLTQKKYNELEKIRIKLIEYGFLPNTI